MIETLTRNEKYGNTGVQSEGLLEGRDAHAKGARWEEIEHRLYELRSLRDDWDGDGTPAPASANVDAASILLRWLLSQRGGSLPRPRITPGTNREVVIAWQVGSNYFELEVTRPDRVEWVHIVAGARGADGAFVPPSIEARP